MTWHIFDYHNLLRLSVMVMGGVGLTRTRGQPDQGAQ